jgi:hypothetical protein
MPRRRFLKILLLALTLGNAVFLVWRWRQDTTLNAAITYVGLDSMEYVIRKSSPALMLEKGQWHANGQRVSDPAAYLRERGVAGNIAVVSLTSRSPFMQLVRSIRDLKARGVCHVMIREGGTPVKSQAPAHEGFLEAQLLVLCGDQLGDEGEVGTIARDHEIHVEW